MTDGRDVTETGDTRPWWRTSADDGADDPIARLLEEPGPKGPGPAEERAPGQPAAEGVPAAEGGPEAEAEAEGADAVRRPMSLVAVALLAGALAMVMVIVAALSAGGRDGSTTPAGCPVADRTCAPAARPADVGCAGAEPSDRCTQP
jgi:hypothetical protein